MNISGIQEDCPLCFGCLFVYIIPILILLFFNTDNLVNLMQLIFWLVSPAAGTYNLVKSGSVSEKAENRWDSFLVLWVGGFLVHTT